MIDRLRDGLLVPGGSRLLHFLDTLFFALFCVVPKPHRRPAWG